MKLRNKIAMAVAAGVLALPLLGMPKINVSAATVVREGIDVSGFTNDKNIDKKIDWNYVKSSGKKFVFVRCGYRGPTDDAMERDNYFETNLRGALDAGLDVGVYYVSQALNKAEAVEEADYTVEKVKNVLGKNKKYELTLPIVVDFEDESGNPDHRLAKAKLSVAAHNDICSAFCDRVESKGYTAMYYTSKNNLENKFAQSKLSAKYPLWFARYNDNKDCGNSQAVVWQYRKDTNLGTRVINVDLDRQYIKTPASVKTVKAVFNGTKATLSWEKVPGVYGYQVFRKSAKTNKEELIATVKGAGNFSYVDEKMVKGTVYAYSVRGMLKTNEGNHYGPKTYANRYKVTLKTNGGQVKSGSVGSYAYGIKTTLPTNVVKKGYLFKGWYTSSNCKTGKTTTINPGTTGNKIYYAKWEKVTVSKPAFKSLKSPKSKQMVVTIKKKIANANGYQIKYSMKSNMKSAKTATITKNSTLSKTISGLQKGKKYYVQIRAYRYDSMGNKVYSGYTGKWTVTIKK